MHGSGWCICDASLLLRAIRVKRSEASDEFAGCVGDEGEARVNRAQKWGGVPMVCVKLRELRAVGTGSCS